MDPPRLGTRARRVLGCPDTPTHVSTLSFWEISLKYSIGTLAT